MIFFLRHPKCLPLKRKKIRTAWTEYFNFTTREKRGSIFLAGLLLIHLIGLLTLRQCETEFPKADSALVAQLLSGNTNIISHVDTSENEIEKSHPVYFEFDPNNTDSISWLKLGLTSRQIKTINNFLEKGGRFRIKKDLKKMYGFSEEQYNDLKPFIQLPDTSLKPGTSKKNYERKIKVVDIATADSTELISLRGIGPVLASRIIRYRESLGGFSDLSQLKEVYGISDSLFLSLKDCIQLREPVVFRYVHINSDSCNTFKGHPYLRGKLADLICNYRNQHGPFSSIEELRLLPLVSDENFRKLAPYIRPD